ncbi:hypothetical protein DAEQUDRAFT_739891 [Daedalea quercina L-15889]|uniref:Uncharacterized protein n=1 Tax=Daedalea quercina L-15889 TaxID=1314783 RepID=A0A165N8F9_9APHY|nr:hypothetical protein DAEQUDRAFT_739891 [Daedalea quercina L-15889]
MTEKRGFDKPLGKDVARLQADPFMEGVPPPAYSPVDKPVDKSWATGKNAPASHKGGQPYAAYPPPTAGMSSQPYSGHGGYSQSPYAPMPGPSAAPQAYGGYASGPGYYGSQAYASPSLYAQSPAGYGYNDVYAGLDPIMEREYILSRRAGLLSSPLQGRTYRRRGRGILSGGLMAMATDSSQTTASLLDPPPPSFLRSARPDLPYEPFEPTSLRSLGNDLSQGFPALPPESRDIPHPFATHDVNEDDWRRFLYGVKSASALSQAANAQAGMELGLLGMLVSLGVDGATKGRKSSAACTLIDQWNIHFFHPRQITVVLAKGTKAYNGPNSVGPPDLMNNTQDGRWRLVIAYKPAHGL